MRQMVILDIWIWMVTRQVADLLVEMKTEDLFTNMATAKKLPSNTMMSTVLQEIPQWVQRRYSHQDQPERIYVIHSESSVQSHRMVVLSLTSNLTLDKPPACI